MIKNPYIGKPILLSSPEPIPFNPARYERYIWMDLTEIIHQADESILAFEMDSRHRKSNAIIKLPVRAGCVFGIDAKHLISHLFNELLHKGNYYDLSSISDEINVFFYSGYDDEDYEYFQEVAAQYFNIASQLAGMLAIKIINTLGQQYYTSVFNSDVKWNFLCFSGNLALIGNGLLTPDEMRY